MALITDIKGTTETSFTLNAGASQSGANWRSVLQVPASGQTANLTFTLPPNYGTTGQILRTDGAGVMTWITASGGAGISRGKVTAIRATYF